MPNPFSRLVSSIFSPIIEQTVRERLSIIEDDNTFFVGARSLTDSDRDLPTYTRQEILDQCFQAWSENPLARRIVELTSQYVIGSGFDFKCSDQNTKEALNSFWNHRLNRMPSRCVEMCDELTRTGNLFVLISTDQSGFSFVRVLPSNNIQEIVPSPNDIEQPLFFITKPDDQFLSQTYHAYNHLTDTRLIDGSFEPVVLHYAINRPAGAQWGVSDLAPLLVWFRRYTSFLEDRVRLNHFRNSFVYQVKGSYSSESVRKERQAYLTANPPTPGSILVTDASETWSVISPKLEALDAQTDGMAIKKMIAAGAGLPMHFLAEPESSTRTTAEAAGGPTFRRFEQRQNFFSWLLSDLISVVLNRLSQVNSSINPPVNVELKGPDISARDNVSSSISLSNSLTPLQTLYDMGLISKRELLRFAYRLAGEPADVDKLIADGSGVDRRSEINSPPKSYPFPKDPIDTTTGEPKQSVL
jgi:hypothetical protein